MTTIHERIRSRRKKAGLTQAELAKMVGVSRVSLTQWEIGATSPKGENLMALSLALECRPQWLNDGKGDPDTPALLSNVSPAPIGHRLIPIINEVQAGTWREIREDFQTTEMLLTDLELSPFAFALTVRGDSMTPDFREGDRVIRAGFFTPATSSPSFPANPHPDG